MIMFAGIKEAVEIPLQDSTVLFHCSWAQATLEYLCNQKLGDHAEHFAGSRLKYSYLMLQSQERKRKKKTQTTLQGPNSFHQYLVFPQGEINLYSYCSNFECPHLKLKISVKTLTETTKCQSTTTSGIHLLLGATPSQFNNKKQENIHYLLNQIKLVSKLPKINYIMINCVAVTSTQWLAVTFEIKV